jgi:hypothetical protein
MRKAETSNATPILLNLARHHYNIRNIKFAGNDAGDESRWAGSVEKMRVTLSQITQEIRDHM